MYVYLFNHEAAYEIRISDWSSDVCSSSLTSKDVCQARNPSSPAEVEADESSLSVCLMAGGAPVSRPLLPDSPTRAIHHDRSRHRLRTTLPILVRDRRLRRRAGSATAAFINATRSRSERDRKSTRLNSSH